MAYDILAESVALIESGHAEPVRRLSRRRRFAAMAVDVSGDLAVTLFARRSVGCVVKETHVLASRDGTWRYLGGGGGTANDDLLADRPSAVPRYLGIGRDPATDPSVMSVSGSGGVRDGGDGMSPWSKDGGWISHAELRASAQVTSVRVADRLLAVPWHGHVVVVWSGERAPRAVALDEEGKSLAEMQLPSTR